MTHSKHTPFTALEKQVIQAFSCAFNYRDAQNEKDLVTDWYEPRDRKYDGKMHVTEEGIDAHFALVSSSKRRNAGKQEDQDDLKDRAAIAKAEGK